jgi:hypothetical protein
MAIPEGIYAAMITRLKTSVSPYGLKQVPPRWHKDINTFLLSIGFAQSLADPNLYICGDGYYETAIEVKAKLLE